MERDETDVLREYFSRILYRTEKFADYSKAKLNRFSSVQMMKDI
jgi:hypothetical protein